VMPTASNRGWGCEPLAFDFCDIRLSAQLGTHVKSGMGAANIRHIPPAELEPLE
jgi:hypothetical protein